MTTCRPIHRHKPVAMWDLNGQCTWNSLQTNWNYRGITIFATTLFLLLVCKTWKLNITLFWTGQLWAPLVTPLYIKTVKACGRNHPGPFALTQQNNCTLSIGLLRRHTAPLAYGHMTRYGPSFLHIACFFHVKKSERVSKQSHACIQPPLCTV